MTRGVRWSEEEFLEHQRKKSLAAKQTSQKTDADGGVQAKPVQNQPTSLAIALAQFGLGEKIEEADSKKTKKKSKKKDLMAGASVVDGQSVTVKPKKRRGVETKSIFESLALSQPKISYNQDRFALDIPGGRILTYNEMFSILQFRKYEAFRYKKICRELIKRALYQQENLPFFDNACRLTLVRVGTKEMDMDALPVVFKYFLDSLRHEGIIDDDNPNIIAEIICRQEKGEPRLGMYLERLEDWEKPRVPSWTEWTEQTQHHPEDKAKKKSTPKKQESKNKRTKKKA